MDGFRREGRKANCDVFSTLRRGRAVLHPLPSGDDDRLAGAHIELPVARFDAQHSGENERVFLELRRLSRLDPSRWTAHPGHAERRRFGRHPSDEFLDPLRDRKSTRLNSSHEWISYAVFCLKKKEKKKKQKKK